MFDEIAPVYDRMNTLMTLGLDAGWRRAAVEASGVGPGDAVIDVACGTGKLAEALAEQVGPFGRVLAVDLAPGHDRRGDGASTATSSSSSSGSATRSRCRSRTASFDAATIAFGLRNLADFAAGFRELARVVRPGGRVVCLELSVPRPRALGPHLPRGRSTARRRCSARSSAERGAYRYLPTSLEGFPTPDELVRDDARGRAHGRRATGASASARWRSTGSGRGGLTPARLTRGRQPSGGGLLRSASRASWPRPWILVGPGGLERLALGRSGSAALARSRQPVATVHGRDAAGAATLAGAAIGA